MDEQQLVRELTWMLVQKLRGEKVGLYEAMRLMGYVTVALAEAVDLEAPVSVSE
jgi:hypothetical protein